MRKAGIIVQARMGSSRLPGKVMQDLAGAPVLARLFERLRRVEGAPMIVLATSTLAGDDVIADYVRALPDIELWRGSEQDVLKRYADASRHFELDTIIRITADCPLMEPTVIDAVLKAFQSGGCSYADNLNPRTFPHGFDVQIASRHALEVADTEAHEPPEREHVMPFIISRPKRFPLCHISASGVSRADLRLTLDYAEDLALIRGIYERLYPTNPNFGLSDILDLEIQEPALFALNRIHHAG